MKPTLILIGWILLHPLGAIAEPFLPALQWSRDISDDLVEAQQSGELIDATLDPAGNSYVLYEFGVDAGVKIIVKVDAEGERVWTSDEIHGRPEDSWFTSQLLVDGTGSSLLATTAATSEDTQRRITLTKLDAQGQWVWKTQYDEENSAETRFSGMAMGPSNDVFITGSIWDSASTNLLTMKFNSDGEILWSKQYAGPANSDIATAVALDASGDVYVLGTSVGFGTLKDAVTVKYDAETGDQLWANRYDGPDHDADLGVALCVTDKVHVVVRDESRRANAIVKYSSDGDLEWANRLALPGQNASFTSEKLRVDPEGNLYLVRDYYKDRSGRLASNILKLHQEGGLDWSRQLMGGDPAMGFMPEWALRVIVAFELDFNGNPMFVTRGPAYYSGPFPAWPGTFSSLDAEGNGAWTVNPYPSDLPQLEGYFDRVMLRKDTQGNCWVIDNWNVGYFGRRSTQSKWSLEPTGGAAVRIFTPADDLEARDPADVYLSLMTTGAGKVEVMRDDTLLWEATSPPFSFTWSDVPAGSHQVTARYTDTSGQVVNSEPVQITIVTNQWPVVSIIEPDPHSYLIAPASLTLTASAEDPDGAIEKVEFFAANKLGEVQESPYTLSFDNLPAGDYSIVATATDNEGAVVNSTPVPFTVLAENSPPVIEASPESVAYFQGDTALLSIPAHGPGPLHFQWQHGGVDLEGGKEPQLSFDIEDGRQGGLYSLTVTNDFGSRTSDPILLRVYSRTVAFRGIRRQDDQLEIAFKAPTNQVFDLESSSRPDSGWELLERISDSPEDPVRAYPLGGSGPRYFRILVPNP